MRISAAYAFRPTQMSCRTSQVMDQFGISLDQGEHVITRDLEIPIGERQIVILSGESGSGKSTILRLIGEQLTNVLRIDDLILPDCPLIDGLPLECEAGLELLTGCGLGEARLLLRRPSELSEGQRYRFRLALGLSQAPEWLCVDEFTATLDRPLAQVLAGNIQRICRKRGVGLLVATTHEDLLEELQPDVHIRCRMDGAIEVTSGTEGKKKVHCGTNWRSPPDRQRIGRTSLGGITAVTRSVS